MYIFEKLRQQVTFMISTIRANLPYAEEAEVDQMQTMLKKLTAIKDELDEYINRID